MTQSGGREEELKDQGGKPCNIDRPGWEAMYYRYSDLHQTVKNNISVEHKKAEAVNFERCTRLEELTSMTRRHEKEIKTGAQ